MASKSFKGFRDPSNKKISAIYSGSASAFADVTVTKVRGGWLVFLVDRNGTPGLGGWLWSTEKTADECAATARHNFIH